VNETKPKKFLLNEVSNGMKQNLFPAEGGLDEQNSF
jgi:hypothetical protein